MLSSDSSTPLARRGLFLAVVLLGANLRAPITGVGPVLPDIMAGLGLGGTGAGVLNALPLVLFALLSLAAPAVGRRHGLAPVLGMALAAILCGIFVRSAHVPGALWIGTIVLSVGIAFGNVLLPGYVKATVPDRAPRLIGFYAAAMAGVAGLATRLAVPIARLPGLDWRWALGVWAVPALVALVVWRAQARGGVAPVSRPARTGPSLWRQLLAWQIALFFAAHSLVFYSVVDWYATYALTVGVPAATAGFHLLVYQAVAVLSNLGSGAILGRVRDQKLVGLTCGALLVIGMGGLLVAPQAALLWLVFAGGGAGFSMVTSLALFPLRTRDAGTATALSGMAQFVGYLGAAMGPLLFGLLHDATGGWTWSLAGLCVAAVAAAVLGAMSGRDRFVA